MCVGVCLEKVNNVAESRVLADTDPTILRQLISG